MFRRYRGRLRGGGGRFARGRGRCEYTFERVADEAAECRLLGGARASDVERVDFVPLEKREEAFRRVAARPVAAKLQQRFAVLAGKFGGEPRAAGKFFRDGKNDGGIGIADVPFGPRRIIGGGRFAQPITAGDRPVFSEPASRAPAAVRDAMKDRPVQRRAIGAGLAAGDDFDAAERRR